MELWLLYEKTVVRYVKTPKTGMFCTTYRRWSPYWPMATHSNWINVVKTVFFFLILRWAGNNDYVHWALNQWWAEHRPHSGSSEFDWARHFVARQRSRGDWPWGYSRWAASDWAKAQRCYCLNRFWCCFSFRLGACVRSDCFWFVTRPLTPVLGREECDAVLSRAKAQEAKTNNLLQQINNQCWTSRNSTSLSCALVFLR